ncbi:MAG: hypothetical protein Q8P83_01710 [bacterium]|nr:hypothetical protein [bacterium]
MKKYEITFATINLLNLNFDDSEKALQLQKTMMDHINSTHGQEGWSLVSVIKEKDFIALFFQREIN